MALAGAGVVSREVSELSYWRIDKKREKTSTEEVLSKYSTEELEHMDDRSPLFRYNL